MRAIQCEALGDATLPVGGGVLRLDTNLPSPDMHDNCVRIKVSSASVNFPDALMIKGTYQTKPTLPFIPGAEVAGVVVEVGPGVKQLKLGDKVCAVCQTGAFAEEVVVPEFAAWIVPECLELESCSAIPVVYGTTELALRHRANLRKGQTLLVLGAAGGVGLAACQIGQLLGAKVVAVVKGVEKATFLRQQGLENVIDLESIDGPLHKAIKKMALKGHVLTIFRHVVTTFLHVPRIFHHVLTIFRHIITIFHHVLTISCHVLTIFRHVLTIFHHVFTIFRHVLTTFLHVLTISSHVLTIFRHVLTIFCHALSISGHVLTIFRHVITIFHHVSRSSITFSRSPVTSSQSQVSQELHGLGCGPLPVVVDVDALWLLDQAHAPLLIDQHVVQVFFPNQSTEKLFQVLPNILLVKNTTLHGIFWGSYMAARPQVLREGMQAVLNWMAEGKLKVQVSHRYPLEAAHLAFEAIGNRKVLGKAIITMQPTSKL
eukprot:gene10462-8420_t